MPRTKVFAPFTSRMSETGETSSFAAVRGIAALPVELAAKTMWV